MSYMGKDKEDAEYNVYKNNEFICTMTYKEWLKLVRTHNRSNDLEDLKFTRLKESKKIFLS